MRRVLFITSGIAACYLIKLVVAYCHEVHARLAVELRQAHLDKLAVRGGDVLADVVGADWELAVPAVDQHRELDGGRS